MLDNAVIADIQGDHSALPVKDLSNTTVEVAANSHAVSGGAGSAGAGNQFQGIEINGITYKFLHDGTV